MKIFSGVIGLTAFAPVASASTLILGAAGHPGIWYEGTGQHPYQGGYTLVDLEWAVGRQLDVVSGMGLQFYRVDLPANPYQAVEYLKVFVRAGAARNVKILPILHPYQCWEAAWNGDYWGARNYAEIIVSGIQSDGGTRDQVAYWEMGNEFDNCTMVNADWDGDGVVEPGEYAAGDQRSHYEPTLHANARAVIRGMADGIGVQMSGAKRIINGGYLHWGHLDLMIDAGVSFEVIGWHWYSDMGSLDAASPHTWMNTISHLSGSFYGGRPIWMTEFDRRNGSWDGESAQASWINDTLNQWEGWNQGSYPKLQAAFVYELADQPQLGDWSEQRYGILTWDQDGQYATSIKQAYYTLMNQATPVCGEASCTGMSAAYISHYEGANCTGKEWYYTPYFNNDGTRRSWDGRGRAGTTKYTVTNRSYRDWNGNCFTAWPNGNRLSGFVRVWR